MFILDLITMDELDRLIEKYDGLKRNVEGTIESQRTAEAMLKKLLENFTKISAQLVNLKATLAEQESSKLIDLSQPIKKSEGTLNFL